MARNLLVVEDSKPIASVIRQIGEALDFNVVLAKTLSEVEAILNTDQEFFAATIDYALPDAPDGQAIELVLANQIPSLVLTGKMDDKTRERILSLPVIDYIPKENSQAFLYLKRILHWQTTNSSIGVLVVDDSLSARKHVTELLKRRNFKTFGAKNGVEALEVLHANPNIKMVITDLEMPEMDGIVLTNEIRKNYNRDQLSIIGISGATSGIHSARFIKNGADDFLRKPFCPEEFYCRITQNIESLSHIEQIKHAANTDYLTDLPNRRAFFQQSQQFIAKCLKSNVPYCAAMIDLDHFKQINDNYGHEAGDHVLKVVSLYMRKYLGNSVLGRMGGEEFAVILAGVNEDQMYSKLDDFRRELSIQQVPFEDNAISVSVSIGAAMNVKAAVAQQLNLADSALYNAKENGRNQVVIHGDEHED